MSYQPPTPDADRLLCAELQDTALRHAKRLRALTPEEMAAAIAELRELAAGRVDLLAECAGILIGASEGTHNARLDRCAAGLLIRAGAGLTLVPRWIEEGRKRGQRHSLPR